MTKVFLGDTTNGLASYFNAPDKRIDYLFFFFCNAYLTKQKSKKVCGLSRLLYGTVIAGTYRLAILLVDNFKQIKRNVHIIFQIDYLLHCKAKMT